MGRFRVPWLRLGRLVQIRRYVAAGEEDRKMSMGFNAADLGSVPILSESMLKGTRRVTCLSAFRLRRSGQYK